MQNQTGNSLLKVGKRSERYTHQELRFLLKEVQKYPNIIESPNSHSETKHRKLLLWQYISQKLRDEFPNSSPKSALQLRNWWKRTKSRAKQRLSSVLFTSAKCKYSNDSSREFHENKKEDSEFTKFLSETSEEYSEEIMCESSTSSNSVYYSQTEIHRFDRYSVLRICQLIHSSQKFHDLPLIVF
ncbi:hypothetical protein KSF78_0003451 [Schistosoma japonicum]|nr:hypothetical protein KSF78_0003451 [Schistosoma japonicum]